jgi:hypothetical protein
MSTLFARLLMETSRQTLLKVKTGVVRTIQPLPQTQLHPSTHKSILANNTTALHSAGKDAPTSEFIANCLETTTGSLPPDEHTNVKRSVLDESDNSLEAAPEALKTQTTDRIADSTAPGKCTTLANTTHLLGPSRQSRWTALEPLIRIMFLNRYIQIQPDSLSAFLPSPFGCVFV